MNIAFLAPLLFCSQMHGETGANITHNNCLYESGFCSEYIQLSGDTITVWGPILPGCYDVPDQFLVLAQGKLKAIEGHLYKINQLKNPFVGFFNNAIVTTTFSDSIPEGVRRIKIEDLRDCNNLKVLAEGDFKAVEKSIDNDKWSIEIPYTKTWKL